MTDTVDKVGRSRVSRNFRTQIARYTNWYCAAGRLRESKFRLDPWKVLYQQYRPWTNIGGCRGKCGFQALLFPDEDEVVAVVDGLSAN